MTFNNIVQENGSEFLVSADAYRGENVFNTEVQRIFEKTWIYLCHESEIPNAYDFKSTLLGRRPVIVKRTEDGSIEAFFNVCTHRGSTLCREEYGNSRTIVCPYHGWAFNASGALIGVPDPQRYPESFDPGTRSLKKVSRVESYAGLVFGCMDSSSTSLSDHLGPVKRHLDRWVRRAAGGVIRVATAHRYAFDGNWKFQSENVHDGYHPGFVHRSAFNAIRKFSGSFHNRFLGAVRQQGLTRGYPQGHGVVEAGTPLESGGVDQDVRDRYVKKLTDLYGATEAEQILNNCQFLIFPNLAIFDFNIRVIQPIGHEQTEVYSYPVVFDDTEQPINTNRLIDAQTRVGAAGILSMDDVDIFCGNQNALSAADDLWIDLSRGHGMEDIDSVNGERCGAFSDETPQRSFWRKWQALMEVK